MVAGEIALLRCLVAGKTVARMNITKISKTGHSTLRLSCFNVDSGIMGSEYSQIGKKFKPVLQQNFNLYLKTTGSSIRQSHLNKQVFLSLTL